MESTSSSLKQTFQNIGEKANNKSVMKLPVLRIFDKINC